MKLIWLSDLHFACAGETVLGHDPSVRLAAAIDDINTYHADAHLCIVSGDLVNRGGEKEYRELKTHLDELAMRWIPMVGNHDNRALLKAELTPAGLHADQGFVQYHVPTGAGHIVCIDTLKENHDSGEYCASRYAWLNRTLSGVNGAPVYIFMHHPPAPIGLPMQDQDCLENGNKFLDFLKDHADVRHIFAGHVHRPVTGTLNNIPFTTMRSCLYQAPPPWPAWNWDTFVPASEAPNYGIILMTGQNVLVHYHQFAAHNLGLQDT